MGCERSALEVIQTDTDRHSDTDSVKMFINNS